MPASTVARIPRTLAYDCDASGYLLMIATLRIAVRNPCKTHIPATTRAVRKEGVRAEAFVGEREVALGKKSRKRSNLNQCE